MYNHQNLENMLESWIKGKGARRHCGQFFLVIDGVFRREDPPFTYSPSVAPYVRIGQGRARGQVLGFSVQGESLASRLFSPHLPLNSHDSLHSQWPCGVVLLLQGWESKAEGDVSLALGETSPFRSESEVGRNLHPRLIGSSWAMIISFSTEVHSRKCSCF